MRAVADAATSRVTPVQMRSANVSADLGAELTAGSKLFESSTSSEGRDDEGKKPVAFREIIQIASA